MPRNFKIQAGLRKLKGSVRKIKLFGYDIETYDNNKKFYCASLVSNDYTKFFLSKEEVMEELATNQIFRNSFICATNLMFDFFGTFSLSFAIKHFTIIERGGSLVFAKTYISYNSKDKNFYSKQQLDNLKHEGKINSISDEFYPITFIDSLNHLSASVDNLGQIIGVPKLTLPDGMIGTKPQTETDKEIMKEYNIRDSLVTYTFMEFLQTNYNQLGANLKITISSTSMDLFRRKHLEFNWYQEKREDINFCYNAYYGGRTEAFKRGLYKSENYGKIKVFDVNSLYPHCLRKFEFPMPHKSYRVKKITTEEVENFKGVGEFTLKIPVDCNIPIVPYKTDKLLFPVGVINGHYDFNTVKLALNNGAEIIKTGEGLIYEHSFMPFKSIIDSLYKMKLKFKKRNDGSYIVPKILMNGFYGKFGYNYKDKERLGNVEDVCNAGEDVSIIPTRDKNIFRLISSEFSNIPNYVFPIFPLYVTSYARQEMYKKFKSTGFDRVMYSDTDCIFTTRNLSTSDEIGELKLEETFEEVIIVKPKFYAGKLYNEDKSLIKVKGMHGKLKDYNNFKDLVGKNKFNVKTQHFRKLRGAIGFENKFVNQIYDVNKNMGLDDDKRVWSKNKFSLNPQESNPIKI